MNGEGRGRKEKQRQGRESKGKGGSEEQAGEGVGVNKDGSGVEKREPPLCLLADDYLRVLPPPDPKVCSVCVCTLNFTAMYACRHLQTHHDMCIHAQLNMR